MKGRIGIVGMSGKNVAGNDPVLGKYIKEWVLSK